MNTQSSKVLYLFAGIALLALFMPGGPQPLAAQGLDLGDGTTPLGQEFVPDQLLVRFRPSVTAQRADQILAERGTSRMRRIRALDVHVMRLPPGLSVERAVAVFSQLPEVEFAEPNYILRVLAPTATVVDQLDQWALDKIQAPDAWNIVSGPHEPSLLAIVDSGIRFDHPDLAANIWENTGETGTDGNGNDKSSNGIDDDSNGYVDDWRGWDFVNNDNQPLDDNMHGTAVSSVAAAVQNEVGLVGVCPWCQLVGVKVIGADGTGTLDVVANGITYAADTGARAINLSLAGAFGSATLENAVNYAWDQGALVVAGAGNDGAETVVYPAGYANAMPVASTNATDYRSCFSNYSQDYISVAAPGEAIITADLSEDGYGTYSGTSLSTPHVVGLGGLLFSQNPSRTNVEVRDLIEATTNDLGPEGTDAFFGTGRINAYRAVTGDSLPTTPPTGLFSDDLSASGYAHARKLARDANGILHLVWHGKDAGQYRVLYVTSSDDGATWSEPNVVFASSVETYHPALAVDDTNVYIAFPSKDDSSSYRILFTWKPLTDAQWSTPPAPLMGGGYDAVRPDLYLDPSNGKLHLVASGLDDAPYVYYRSSADKGANWSSVRQISVGYNTRYADVHANGDNVYIAGRSLEFWLMLIPRYRVFTIRSSNNGDSWGDLTELAVHDGLLSGEYGASLAGMGDQLYLGYEHNGAVYFRRSQGGVNWSAAENLGAGAWPSITQAADGQAWLIWESEGGLTLRRYTGSAWDPAEAVGGRNYANLKLGTNGGLVEWTATHCSGAPFRLIYGSRVYGTNNPPTFASDPIVEADATEDVAYSSTIADDATDPDSDPLTFSKVSGSAWLVVASDGTLSGTPTDADLGLNSWTVEVNDGNGGTDQATLEITVINTNDPPVASFTNICTGLSCDFDASGSNDPDGAIVSYDWDYGDGSLHGGGVTASHTYATAGIYTVVLTVTDNSGATDTDTQYVTVNDPPTVHVGDLDGGSADAPRGRWEATVTITVHDSNEGAVFNALVEGVWSAGASDGASCTTDASGQCSVTKGNLKNNVASVTFSVSNVTRSADAYVTDDNHDPDGDSDGTTITVDQPVDNTPPTVNITAPADGATFASGATIDFAGTAGDAEDGDATASLVWTSDIDGQIGTGGSFSAELSDGVHTITATATDSDGASGSDSVGISVGNPPTMHVGDLDGVGQPVRSKWEATVTITVHDQGHNPLANAIVAGAWNNGAKGGAECTTDGSGQCIVVKGNLKFDVTSVTFTVDSVTLTGYSYAPAANHEDDVPSDSDGTSITVGKP